MPYCATIAKSWRNAAPELHIQVGARVSGAGRQLDVGTYGPSGGEQSLKPE
jgi:hypothetical protein